jgi:hypothetical protein
MTETTTRMPRRQLVLLGALLLTLVALLVWQLMPSLAGSGSAQPAPVAAAPAGDRRPATSAMVDVKLERLSSETQEPADGGRNPFKMGAAAKPADNPAAAKPAAPVAPPPPTVPVGPAPPPPVPPIPFRFIGVLTGPAGVGKIAVLSDGKVVVHGKEGAEIEGRYRILRIADDSVQIEHLDGRGRQTIRLSGAP